MKTTDPQLPIISLGQGDYRRDYPAGSAPAQAEQPSPAAPLRDGELEAELLGAAIRYVAFADWFERLSVSRYSPNRERRAMDAFNRVEAELRTAGGRLLRRIGSRKLVLRRLLKEVVAS